MSNFQRSAILAAAILLAGCGGDGGGGAAGPGPGDPGDPPPIQGSGVALTSAGGGASGSDEATGGRGGNLIIASGGNLFVGVNSSPLPPELPAAPSSGAVVSSWTGVQTISSGTAFIKGTVTASAAGSEATLNITAGDLVIEGSLIVGSNEPDLTINVPTGTVWIMGSIRTGRVDGSADGDEGGHLRINTQHIVFTGTVDTRGEDPAGDGGDVTFDCLTGQQFSGGSLDLSGGKGTGAAAHGGDAGTFRTGVSSGPVRVAGTRFICAGGSATGTGFVTGGDGGSLDVQGNAGVFFNGEFSGKGGNATSSNGGAQGGRGGELAINDRAISDSGPVSIYGSFTASGGAASGPGNLTGGAGGLLEIRAGSEINLGEGTIDLRGADSSGRAGAGGDATLSSSDDLMFDGHIDASDGKGAQRVSGESAGTITIDTHQGDIEISGSIFSRGGNGSDSGAAAGGPSDGGLMIIRAGSSGGSITLRGTLDVNGGSDSSGSDNIGGSGGRIQLCCRHAAGSIYLDPGSSIQADGGQDGEGGRVEVCTAGGSAGGLTGGNISLRGTIAARGTASGMGGSVLVDSDSTMASSGGADGRGGSITLHSGSTIDVSGGSARNDGSGGVSSPTAVTLDADGNNSNSSSENGVVLNLGAIIAHGSVSAGGDVLLDGLNASGFYGPAPGSLDLQGPGGSGDVLTQ